MGKNSSLPARNYSDVSGLLAYCCAYGMIGMMLTCLGTYLVQLDYFNQWKLFAPPLPGAVELVEGTGYEVKVRTIDGTIYRWGDGDEIWTQSVYNGWITDETCDDYPAAFSPLTHPPDHPQDCAVFQEMGEMVVTVAYVIDQQGAVWRWDINSGDDWVFYLLIPPLGGAIGIVTGIVVRSVLISRERKAAYPIPPAFRTVPTTPGEGSATPCELTAVPGEAAVVAGETSAQPVPTRKPQKTWLLAVGLVVIVAVLISIRSTPAPKVEDNRNDAIYTQLASTLNTYKTAEAEWYYSPPATPDPAGPAYDFAAQCPLAQWRGWTDTYQCSGSMRPGMVNIDVIQYMDAGLEAESQAVRVYLPRQKSYITGRYPVWEIQPDDHFRATLVCPPEVDACSLRFSLYFEQHLEQRTPLGEWELTNDRRTFDADVDLSHFSGRVVSFVLEISNIAPEPVEQTALWVNPRIENVPSPGINLLPLTVLIGSLPPQIRPDHPCQTGQKHDRQIYWRKRNISLSIEHRNGPWKIFRPADDHQYVCRN